ncbi:GTPase [Actinomadura sp. NPDC000600]|uniref:GTPase n=1 Tax=Actinomadura sp. NPDC000600 TaxID=3154262 RepID=UPI0033961E90
MTASPGAAAPRGDVVAALGELCLRLERRLEFRNETVLLDAARQCREPLRVAVIGDVSTGKSTLVNALLAAKVAKTRRMETTARVTWYRRSDAAAPPDLGPVHRTATLDRAFTAHYTLVDTPGMNTPSQWALATTEMLAADSPTAGAAAALIFLMRDAIVWKEARERIGRFLRLTGGAFADKGNVIVVGAKADAVPGASAAEVEADLAADTGLPPERVAAVNQRLAESARCGLLADRHLRTLREIAADESMLALSAAGRGPAALRNLWTAHGRDPADVHDLHDVLGTLNWVGPALPDLVANCRTVAELAGGLDGLSRVPRLEALLHDVREDAELFTTRTVVRRLERFAAHCGPERAAIVRRELAGLVERPEYRRLDRRAAALALEGTAMSYVPRSDRDAAARLLRGEIPATAEMGRRWRGIARRPGRPSRLRRVAETVAEAALDGKAVR